MFITSSQNSRVKDAVHLRDRRHREKTGRILIDGARELRRAIAAGIELAEIFLCEPLCRTAEARALASEPPPESEVLHVSEAVFEKLAFGRRAEGVLGVAATPRSSLAELVPRLENIGSRPPLVAVLEGVEKPGNVGAVLRSADAAGVSAVILADPRTDLYNPNAIRASLGTIFTVPVCEASTREVIAWLRDAHFAVAAARVDGSASYTTVDYRLPTAIVLGNEAAGLSAAWNAPEITAIRLPMFGIADSLNVSVTAAVIFYEALRQRGAG